MTSSSNIAPLDATFGAIIRGVKVAALDDVTFRDLYALWLKYALLIFPDQHLSRAEQIAFARRFGNLEFEFLAISNVKADGTLINESNNSDMLKILQGNMGWHCDSTYMAVQAKAAVFSAITVPAEGGETGWADMRAAYDALSETMRTRIEQLAALRMLPVADGSDHAGSLRNPAAFNNVLGFRTSFGRVPSDWRGCSRRHSQCTVQWRIRAVTSLLSTVEGYDPRVPYSLREIYNEPAV
jgi:alpha-ketoglutarate-dependent taurine dioxygenase